MTGPHQDQPLERAGADLAEARGVMILAHGRGATARGILDLADEIAVEGIAALAPQAAGHEWYPNSFLAPVESNQPGLRSGLQAIDDAVEVARAAGVPRERVLVGGFSQGACLAMEWVGRNADRYGAAVALSGGLIGDSVERRRYDGDLDGTPVFLGCSDRDPHIPVERVHETAAVMADLGGDVDERIYEGMGHGVNQEELEALAKLVAEMVAEGE
jgi:phospholipase/carboxylesterase